MLPKLPRRKKPPQQPPEPPKPLGLSHLFESPIELPQGLRLSLDEHCRRGLKLFEGFNQNRMELAFASFDQPMKRALFEILYLLDDNSPLLKDWRFKAPLIDERGKREVERSMDLYLEGCPAGVLGMDSLPELFEGEFEEFAQETFGQLPGRKPHLNPAVVGIFSIGSIGTVGHKHLASDLDLEVVYRTEPFDLNPGQLTDQHYKAILLNQVKASIQREKNRYRLKAERLSPEDNEKIAHRVRVKEGRRYPLLFAHLLLGQRNLAEEYRTKGDDHLKMRVIEEISQLLVSHRRQGERERAAKETLLVKRIGLIQEYVNQKYPTAEIYLFAMSEAKMAQGQFASTLANKESSGKAYEKILNYDTLMPGIYFNGGVPSHFLFDQSVNDNQSLFAKLTQYLRMGILPGPLAELKGRLIDQGPLPDLDQDYVKTHYAAIYWEAFKSASGNLPKAFLNLLRYEMILNRGLNKSVTQLIKEPKSLDHLAQGPLSPSKAEAKEDWKEDAQWPQGARAPLSSQDLLQIEARFPHLHYDPWWLRYKALKLAYGRTDLIEGISREEFYEIGLLLDSCFALHLRISDVFDYEAQRANPRARVLTELLHAAFGKEGRALEGLKALFAGETAAVTGLEARLKTAFKAGVDRVLAKTGHYFDDHEEKSNPDLTIWHHFYKTIYERGAKEIPKGILSHLQIPRGQLLIGHEPKKGWFFKALLPKSFRFGAAGKESRVTLVENCDFLWGLAFCIKNHFYGVLDRGSLTERHTSLALQASKLGLETRLDDERAFVNPTQIEHLMLDFEAFFPAKKPSYRAVLEEKRRITHLFIAFGWLRYGRLDFLYLDNLGILRHEQREVPSLREFQAELTEAPQRAFSHPSLKAEVAHFLQKKGIHPKEVRLATAVNANAFRTGHPSNQLRAKEKDLARLLRHELIHLEGFEPLAAINLEAPLKNLKREDFLLLLRMGALLLAIDGEVRGKDFHRLDDLAAINWKPDWGDIDLALRGVLEATSHLFEIQAESRARIQALLLEIETGLTQYQGEALLKILKLLYRQNEDHQQAKLWLVKRVVGIFAPPRPKEEGQTFALGKDKLGKIGTF